VFPSAAGWKIAYHLYALIPFQSEAKNKGAIEPSAAEWQSSANEFKLGV
jgi:hypothetical protein